MTRGENGEGGAMSENSLALYDEAIMPATFDGMMKQADVLAKSGLLPQTVRTGAAAD